MLTCIADAAILDGQGIRQPVRIGQNHALSWVNGKVVDVTSRNTDCFCHIRCVEHIYLACVCCFTAVLPCRPFYFLQWDRDNVNVDGRPSDDDEDVDSSDHIHKHIGATQ
jgi:hypothetical protein